MNDDKPILAARGLDKKFGPVHAVKDVDLDVRVGEILGLVGENGAGKSTLLSMLSGTLRPDAGTINLNGTETEFDSYHQSTLNGVFRVFQHQALVPNITVAENVFLAQEKQFTKFGLLDHKRMVAETRKVFEDFGVELDPKATLSSLSFAERQVVEIVRCLAQARLLGVEHPVILLDEPTSALTRGQIDFFFDFVNRIRNRSAQVFVSHRLEEIVALCDRLVVLKDGAVVAENSAPRELDESKIHSMMVGREISMYARTHVKRDHGEKALELANFTSSTFHDVSFEIEKGEVIGVAGVVGSGKSHLGRAIFELGEGCSGTILINGEVPRNTGPRAGIRSSVGYVPTERHREGIVMSLSVAENLSLPFIGAAIGGNVVDTRKEYREAKSAIEKLKIKTPSARTLIRNLSGGNQQKVILSRWLALESKLLVLDNPTNGVDVGAKGEIYEIIDQLAASGVSVLLISDDLPELLMMSDRVFVMKDGTIKSEHHVNAEKELSEVDLVSEMV
ncbi:MAG: sugar ABC transporter ATP-binding protein [Gulosibacter sp.]|uniref:sugar ABC transporter ATP-binding protein n=1 Tax=Gulosibacter sp. TaxID=2817531 RepID=UPI003F8D97AA